MNQFINNQVYMHRINLLIVILFIQSNCIQCCYRFPAGVIDPCLGLNCSFGADCIRSKDGKKAECICPTECPNYGDSVGSRPVCGSDGRDYPNDCELRKKACTTRQHIVPRFQGACDPCESIDCQANQICQLDDTRNAICRCNAVCQRDFKPVCASDGKSYINECILRVEACKAKKSLRILYNGECGKTHGSNPCETLKCGPYQECEIDRYGIATCICPDTCPPVLKPVCGSDGITYDSECELARISCHNGTSVTIVSHSLCEHSSTCDSVNCSHGAVCHVPSIDDGKAYCKCATCTEEYKPVCGSNGLTFQNECKLKQYACHHSRDISVVVEAPCKGCESKHCEFWGLCKSPLSLNQLSIATFRLDPTSGTCVCPEACIKGDTSNNISNSSGICGSDGNTYESECELQKTSCLKQSTLTIAARGICDVCQGVICKYGARCDRGRCVCPKECPDTVEPVCANTGATFTNECYLRQASCSRSIELSVSFYGECGDLSKKLDSTSTIIGNTALITSNGGGYIRHCDRNTCKYGGVCDYDEDGIPVCICSYQCPSASNSNGITDTMLTSEMQESVCGSDGRLYENECKLQEEACRRQQEIKPQPYRLCEDSKVTPCNGEPPLTDAITGKDLYCGEGATSKPCPSGSYCHKNMHFSKCCYDRAGYKKSCNESMYGCCSDGVTSALGINYAGCPSQCQCNKLGSWSNTCDPITGQCQCRQGVGGVHCERCDPGYWGLHKISEGNAGCLPCSCNPFGSIRNDCEQMSGRCVCKPGLQGIKCSVCPEGTILEVDGCTDITLTRVNTGTCADVRCRHGAICVEKSSLGKGSQCSCNHYNCESINNTLSATGICGSDGYTYPSECHLKANACRLQKRISKLRDEACRNSIATSSSSLSPSSSSSSTGGVMPVVPSSSLSSESVTVQPARRSTMYKSGFTRELPSSFEATVTSTESPPLNKQQDIINIPSFSGQSFILLPRLQAYTRLTIELDFISHSENGILLYNGQTPDGEGDFVSLSIRQGYIEFRFNLGSGAEVIRSKQKILLGQTVKIVAKRYLRDGTLTVEGQDDVAGKSIGDLKSLDLAENLIVGSAGPNAVNKIFDNIGVKRGFSGCIHRFRINGKSIDLKVSTSRDILFSEEIVDCSINPCSINPCLNDGVCLPDQMSESYSCSCELGYTGVNCSVKLQSCGIDDPCVKGTTCTKLSSGDFSCLCHSGLLCSQNVRSSSSVADFSGHQFLQYSPLLNLHESFVIEIWFMSRSPNGVLIFHGQKHAQNRGDFFTLYLMSSQLYFTFDLGLGGNNSLTLNTSVTLNEWHSVRITRIRKTGTLQLDNGPVSVASTYGTLNELNLDEPFFVGGHPDLKATALKDVPSGLNGAIQRIVVNGMIWDDLSERSTTSKYNGPPCGPINPCLNDAVCIAQLNTFVCKCPSKYSGRTCNRLLTKEDLERAVSFDGSTLVNVPFEPIHSQNDGENGRRENHLSLSIRTSSKSGLILWTHKGSTLKTDYLALALVDGYLELSYNLGKQKELFVVRSTSRIADSSWHHIIVSRHKRQASIQIDSNRPVTGVSEEGANELNTDGILWIGGGKDIPSGLPSDYYVGFVGCFKDLKVDGQLISLTSYSESTLRFCGHE